MASPKWEFFKWFIKRTNDIPDLLKIKQEYIDYANKLTPAGRFDPLLTKDGLKLDDVILEINNKLVKQIESHIEFIKEFNWRGDLDDIIEYYLDLLP